MISPNEVHQLAVEKGFWDTPRNFGECLMLVVSELGEAIEAHRQNDPTHVAEEIADAVIRLYDLSEGFGIDLNAEIAKKHEFNKTRSYRHGKQY